MTGDLIIPEGVTSIGDSAFSWCSGLTGELIIPESVTSIGNRVFFNCVDLTGDLIISERMTSIGYCAFCGCYNLTSIEFQDTEGWYVTENADAEEGIEISSEDLSDTAKAAELLTSTYCDYYWKKH